jgi:hypothetical protein
MGGLRIGADLKTISMWNIKQEGLRETAPGNHRARLPPERGYVLRNRSP